MRGPHSKVNRSLQEKWTAAQQRQYQRDRRRRYTNPDRTQAEEDAERLRKHEQGIFDRRRDPYDREFGDYDYAVYREERLREDCERNRVHCNFHALDWNEADRRYNYDWVHGERYRTRPDRTQTDRTRTDRTQYDRNYPYYYP